ncbi:hypothetical protein OPQ81_007960, partial [Rhizoctonia solani]
WTSWPLGCLPCCPTPSYMFPGRHLWCSPQRVSRHQLTPSRDNYYSHLLQQKYYTLHMFIAHRRCSPVLATSKALSVLFEAFGVRSFGTCVEEVRLGRHFND